MANSKEYNDAPYVQAVSSFSVPGLYPNFNSAAMMLRMARSELRVELAEHDDGTAVVESFYNLLDRVEAYLKEKPSHSVATKFILEVEGLDGSGKTTLVEKLREALPHAIATKTPSASLRDIRPLWDHRGGILARAFYMVSNYILEYEIANCERDIIIVDRWYASTCAYTVAHPKDATAAKEQATITPISDLAQEIFEWPNDLQMKPQLLLVLQIDPDVRQRRVEQRVGGASRFNPWDDRLAKDPALGTRILEALSRIRGPSNIQSVNANLTITEVVNEALQFVRPAVKKHFDPQDHFASKPLEWWKYTSQQLHLCDEYGKRAHHALWNLHVSYNRSGDSGPPVMKTVGLDRIDSNCVYYWTSNSAFSSQNIWASVMWMGEDPECQWRAEGYLTRVTPEECVLRGFQAPPSLIAHVTACCACEYANEGDSQRTSRPEKYDDSVHVARQSPDPSSVCMIRFVPIRMEVLRGGPSTRLDGFPQRWEWSRDTNAGSKTGDWTMRSILPFPRTISPLQKMTFRGVSIAIIGTHGSGKSTIGAKLAKLLGWRFDDELGASLRDQNSLVSSGHLHGNGSTTTPDEQQNWDHRVHEAECQRDQGSAGSRIVETWHIGNGFWYQLRQKQQEHMDLEQYKSAIAKHQETSLVLLVQLTLKSPSVMVARREQYTTMQERLPMKDDENECKDLHQALQRDIGDFLSDVTDTLGIPFLQIDNGRDGKEAIEESLLVVVLEPQIAALFMDEDKTVGLQMKHGVKYLDYTKDETVNMVIDFPLRSLEAMVKVLAAVESKPFELPVKL